MSNSIGIPLPFPQTLPANDQPYGFAVVSGILSVAESVLGARKPGVKLTHISMTAYSPRISVDASLTNVHVQLTDCAGRDWESFVGEFAHEVVHVLNPRIGNASYLEEGIAEVFSHYVQRELGIKILLHNFKQYNDAVAMLRELPLDPLVFAKEVRVKLGQLTGFGADELLSHFPEIGAGLARKLCSECRTIA